MIRARTPHVLVASVFAAGILGFLGTWAGAQPAPRVKPTTQPMSELRASYAKPTAEWPAADWDDSIAPDKRHELGLVPEVVHPADNPYSRMKVDLGRRLFFDPRLSGSAAVACVSCHSPDLGWADGKTTSQGHQLTPLDRNAPTLYGAAYQRNLMWDGRAGSLEDQALLPLGNEKEMHADFTDVVRIVSDIPEYRAYFKEVFGEETITMKRITQAIATFERTIPVGYTRFDQFLRGDVNALNEQELRGLHLFRTKARCINCHNGPILSDGEFHNVGLTYYKRKFEDLGRYRQTNNPADIGAFRTPTLRNLKDTGPYMHNGFFQLNGVINMYNAGMATEKVPEGDPLAPKKSPILKVLKLTDAEKADLQAFLEDALDEPWKRVRVPKLPGLYGEDPTTQPAVRDARPAEQMP